MPLFLATLILPVLPGLVNSLTRDGIHIFFSPLFWILVLKNMTSGEKSQSQAFGPCGKFSMFFPSREKAGFPLAFVRLMASTETSQYPGPKP